VVSKSDRFDIVFSAICFFVLVFYASYFDLVKMPLSSGFLGSRLEFFLADSVYISQFPVRVVLGLGMGFFCIVLLIRQAFANNWLKLILCMFCLVPEQVYWWFQSLDSALNSLLLVCLVFGWKRNHPNMLVLSACGLLYSWYLGWMIILYLLIYFQFYPRHELKRSVVLALAALVPAWVLMNFFVPQPGLWTFFSSEARLHVALAYGELGRIWFLTFPVVLLPLIYACVKKQWFLLVILAGPVILPPNYQSEADIFRHVMILWPVWSYLMVLVIWDVLLLFREMHVIFFIVLVHGLIYLGYLWKLEAQKMWFRYPNRGIQVREMNHAPE